MILLGKQFKPWFPRIHTHHQVALRERSSLILSSSSIASVRSSKLHPVSIKSRCKSDFDGWATLVRICAGVNKRMLFINLSFLL